jgi:hypothetical protein
VAGDLQLKVRVHDQLETRYLKNHFIVIIEHKKKSEKKKKTFSSSL